MLFYLVPGGFPYLRNWKKYLDLETCRKSLKNLSAKIKFEEKTHNSWIWDKFLSKGKIKYDFKNIAT